MGWRTIIEINHDYLGDVAGEIERLLRMLPSHSEKELKEGFRYCSSVKVLKQRNSYTKITLEVE